MQAFCNGYLYRKCSHGALSVELQELDMRRAHCAQMKAELIFYMRIASPCYSFVRMLLDKTNFNCHRMCMNEADDDGYT